MHWPRRCCTLARLMRTGLCVGPVARPPPRQVVCGAPGAPRTPAAPGLEGPGAVGESYASGWLASTSLAVPVAAMPRPSWRRPPPQPRVLPASRGPRAGLRAAVWWSRIAPVLARIGPRLWLGSGMCWSARSRTWSVGLRSPGTFAGAAGRYSMAPRTPGGRYLLVPLCVEAQLPPAPRSKETPGPSRSAGIPEAIVPGA